MAIKIPKIDEIPKEEQSPLILALLETLNLLYEENQNLKDEIARLKGEKARPEIKPSTLESPKRKKSKKDKKRPGSKKRAKTKKLEIHKTQPIRPENLPPGSTFKGYQDFYVQDLVIQPFNTLFKLERWETPDGKYLVGKLPAQIKNEHFGPDLKRFILYQHYHAHVTQPLILEQLRDLGVNISSGQINRIITEGHDTFHYEKNAILTIGLSVSAYINVDDTGARHKGKNGYCTHIGNELFATFHSTESKSRINFLEILRAGYNDYVINNEALAYMASQGLPKPLVQQFAQLAPSVLENQDQWHATLSSVQIKSKRHYRIATEGALIGSLYKHGFNPELVIVSDDAGQFNILQHALCWIHAERTINKLIGFTEEQIEAVDSVKSQIWTLYDQLKDFKINPSDCKRASIDAYFDEIFTQRTCFASLNQALRRISANKSELLLVLKCPVIPLHNNLSENDIREYVKRRKISGSSRSDLGRKCRDTFVSLKKTCRKLKVSFWEYLNDRITGTNTLPFLPDLIVLKAQAFFA